MPNDPELTVTYFVGVTTHPAMFPGLSDIGCPPENDDDALGYLKEWCDKIWGVPSWGFRGASFQNFMSVITGMNVRIVWNEPWDMYGVSGFRGNNRYYPPGGSKSSLEDFEDRSSDAWEHNSMSYPIPLEPDNGGLSGADPEMEYFPYNDINLFNNPLSARDYVGPPAVQTVKSFVETQPGEAISYLGNMVTARVKFLVSTDGLTEEKLKEYVAEGFDCAFGGKVLTRVKLGYVPPQVSGSPAVNHVISRRILRSSDLVEIQDMIQPMHDLHSQSKIPTIVYNLADFQSIRNVWGS